MPNINDSYSVRDGVLIDEETGGPFLTGGAASPIGLDIPRGQSLYVQTVASDRIVIWQRFGNSTNDWRAYPAQDVSFTDSGSTYKAATTSVKSALEELRTTEISDPFYSTTVLNTEAVLTVDSKTLCIVSGTATGASIKLPDATTLRNGRHFDIINSSSESIDIKDGAGATLFTLNAGDKTALLVGDNGTIAGEWVQTVTSNTATGIVSEVISSDVAFATSSTTDVLITGFTVTPVSGRYSVFYSADITISTNNKDALNVVYVDGVAVENTRRETQGVGSGFKGSAQSIGEVTVDGTEVVDVRVSVTGGSLTVNSRSLILIRLGT